MKHFYNHLVEIETLTVELNKIELAEHEKHELAGLIDSNIRNAVMDAILSKIPDSEKKKFAELATEQDHQKIWQFLKSKSAGIEDDIKKTANDIKKQLSEDIKEASRLHSQKAKELSKK